MLNVIDEFTRECPAIRVDRRLKSTDVIDVLSDLFILRGVPGHVRSDDGPEFIAKAVRASIAAVGARTAFIEPGSPWENGYCESFNSKLRDEGHQMGAGQVRVPEVPKLDVASARISDHCPVFVDLTLSE
jgi:putative transposase